MITGYLKIRLLVENEYIHLVEEIGIPTEPEEEKHDNSFQFCISQLEIYVNEGSITKEQQQEILAILNNDDKSLEEVYLEVINLCTDKENQE